MDTNKELTLAEFQPAEAQLKELAQKAKTVDESNILAVHDTRIELRDARILITKKGKELREGALQFQKAVILKEKDLLAIIQPDEDRLDVIEEAAKAKIEAEKRRVELPTRIAALKSIDKDIIIHDDHVLGMDDAQFNEWRLKLIEDKLTSDRLKAEALQRENDRIAREKLDAERAEFEVKKRADEAVVAEKKRIDDAKIASERAEIDREKARLAGIEEQRQREEASKRAEIERQEREVKLKADVKAKIEAEKEYKDWLVKIGWDDSKGDTIGRDKDGNITAWRILGTYNPNKKQ